MTLSKDQHLAVMFAHQARAYLEATRRVLGQQSDGYADLEMADPAGFLIAHAIEVGLRGYLRFHGIKTRQKGHKLLPLLAMAEAAGLSVPHRFKQYVQALAPAHEGYQFRFARSDPRAFVLPRTALPVVKPVIDKIAADLTASTEPK